MTKIAIDPQETIAQYAERISMRFAIVVGPLFGLLVLFANLDRNPVPMMEDVRSFGIMTFLMLLPAIFIVSGIAFVLGVQAWNSRVAENRRRRWGVPVLFVAIAYMLVVGFVTVLVLTLVEFGFQHLALDKFQGAFIAGAVGAAVTLWIAKQAMLLRNGDMLELIVIIVAGGVYLTAISIDDPLWWKVSFSYLGKFASNARMIFNFTLFFAGVLIMIWVQYFINDVKVLVRHDASTQRNAKIVSYLLFALGIAIILVGIFPSSSVDQFSDKMHLVGAYSLGLIFALLMAGARWLAPGYPREFIIISWTLLGLMVATLILTGLGYFNTVGLEIIAFGLGMMWLSLFIGTTGTRAQELEPEAFPV